MIVGADSLLFVRCWHTEDVKSPDEQLREKQSGAESWPDAAPQEQTAEAAAISN